MIVEKIQKLVKGDLRQIIDKNLKNYLNKYMIDKKKTDKNDEKHQRSNLAMVTENDIEDSLNESNANLNFDLDDIESLQDADLDKELLENHFINHETKEEILKK